MSDAIGLLCIFSLVTILGGGIVVMLYGVRGTVSIVRGTVAMLLGWLDRK